MNVLSSKARFYDNELFCADSLSILKTMPSSSVDMVITSPPYNMNLRIRNGKYCSRQITKELTTKYEGFSDNLPMEDYFEFSKNIVTELLRVSDLVFYNVQFLTGNKPALFKLLGFFADYVKEFIVWDKINAEPAIGAGVLNSRFEVIIVFQKSKPESRSFATAQFKRGTLQNLLQIKRGKPVSNKHKAVMPIELADLLVKNFSQDGATILDPFMGTGTTGIACAINNRRFIGIELLYDYFTIAKDRIHNECSKRI